MKLQTPYSITEFNRLNKIRKFEVETFRAIPEKDHLRRKVQAEIVLNVVEKLYKYINVVDYNKYARSRCRFGNMDDTREVCEKKFKNTLSHFSTTGNCCKSCNSVIVNRVKKIYVQD